MISPKFRLRYGCIGVLTLALTSIFVVACKKTQGEPTPPPKPIEEKKPAPAVATWLGNAERNYYGSGPWQEGKLEVVWEFKTSSTSGRLHKDPWGGTSWPGQPSVEGDRVDFPSADGNTYALNRADGALIWKFKAKDSQKSTPTIVGDRIINSGLDHHVYCLNKKDGTLIWDYETGFEVDGSVAVVGERVYFGGEDRNFYCLTLSDGKLVYKTPGVGSVEAASPTRRPHLSKHGKFRVVLY